MFRPPPRHLEWWSDESQRLCGATNLFTYGVLSFPLFLIFLTRKFIKKQSPCSRRIETGKTQTIKHLINQPKTPSTEGYQQNHKIYTQKPKSTPKTKVKLSNLQCKVPTKTTTLCTYQNSSNITTKPTNNSNFNKFVSLFLCL